MSNTNNTYNGWTNYATWRVNLEMFDGSDWPSQIDSTDVYKLSKRIQAWAEEYIEESALPGLGRDYALAFLHDVNWYEIADHLVMDYMAEELAELGE